MRHYSVLILYMFASGRTMPVPLLTQICHGVSHYSCNVLSEPYLLQARYFFPKVLGVWYFYKLFWFSNTQLILMQLAH